MKNKIHRPMKFYAVSLFAMLHSVVALSAPLVESETVRITSEPLTLDVHFHYHERRNSVYDNEWPVEKRASEITGISLNNVTAHGIDKGNEAFNLMRANDDWPDIVGGTALKEKFNQYGPRGYFLPLDELIEKHAPNIQEFFKNKQHLLNAIRASDGNLYFIPYVPDGKFGRAYFIRTDWLDKLGLKTPDTVDELYFVLTAFLNNDPNGNGMKDEVPFFARDFEEMVRLVTLWDARTSGSDLWHDFYVVDNEIRHGYIEEEYRAGITHLAKWYAEGLIDNDIQSSDSIGDDIRNQRLASNQGGMTHDWFASTASFNDRLADEIPGFAFKPFSPPQSVSGKRIEEHRRTSIKPDGWAITKTNQNIVETVKYFDFWFTPEGKRLANFGIENQEYTLENSQPIFTQEVLNGDLPVNSRLWSVGAQVPRGFPQDYSYERQWTNKIALEGIDLYEKGDYVVDPFHGVTLNADEKETFDFYWNTLLTYMLERQEDWIRGSREIKLDWDSYLVQLNKLGLKKVMGVMQAAYNRQYVSKASDKPAE